MTVQQALTRQSQSPSVSLVPHSAASTSMQTATRTHWDRSPVHCPPSMKRQQQQHPHAAVSDRPLGRSDGGVGGGSAVTVGGRRHWTRTASPFPRLSPCAWLRLCLLALLLACAVPRSSALCEGYHDDANNIHEECCPPPDAPLYGTKGTCIKYINPGGHGYQDDHCSVSCTYGPPSPEFTTCWGNVLYKQTCPPPYTGTWVASDSACSASCGPATFTRNFVCSGGTWSDTHTRT